MNGLSPWTHLAAATALVVNLWVGGDYVEAWLGHGFRSAFELALILAYVVFVLGIRVPLAFWRRPSEPPDGGSERPDARERPRDRRRE